MPGNCNINFYYMFFESVGIDMVSLSVYNKNLGFLSIKFQIKIVALFEVNNCLIYYVGCFIFDRSLI